VKPNMFGEKLKAIRKAKKETLRTLAGRANLSYSFISSIEAGRYRPSKETVIALTEALDYPHVNEMLLLSGYAPRPLGSDEGESLDFAIARSLATLSTEDKQHLLALIERMQSPNT
jgi:transcriptional regulator with XRE-family HTH domain